MAISRRAHQLHVACERVVRALPRVVRLHSLRKKAPPSNLGRLCVADTVVGRETKPERMIGLIPLELLGSDVRTNQILYLFKE